MALPYEYQSAIDDAERRRGFAQLLLKRAQQPAQGQMVGKHYVRSNPMQHIAQLLTGLSGAYGDARASEEVDKVRRSAAEAERSDLQGVIQKLRGTPGSAGDNLLLRDDEGNLMPGAREAQAPDPMGAETTALSSRFDSVRKLAEALQKQRMDLLKTAAPTSSGASVQDAAMAGGDVSKLRPNTWGPVETQVLPNGATSWRSEDQRGGAKMGVAAPPTNVNVSTGKAAFGTLEQNYKDTITRRPEIEQVAQQIPFLQQAAILAERGGLTQGTGAEYVGALKGLAPWLGLDPKMADTETVRAAAVQQMGQVIKLFGAGTALSDSDRKAAAQAVADPYSVKDPEALKRLSQISMHLAVMNVSNFNKQIAELKGAYEAIPENTTRWTPPLNPVTWSSRLEGTSPQEQQMLERGMLSFPNVIGGQQPPAPPQAPAGPQAPRRRRRVDLTQEQPTSMGQGWTSPLYELQGIK